MSTTYLIVFIRMHDSLLSIEKYMFVLKLDNSFLNLSYQLLN